MEGPPLGPGGEDITWPDQVAPRGRKASSTRKIKPQTYRRSTVRHDVFSLEVTNRKDLWNKDISKLSNVWVFYSTKAQTLGPGQFRALAPEHVFVFQHKSPVDSPPGEPNLRLLYH